MRGNSTMGKIAPFLILLLVCGPLLRTARGITPDEIIKLKQAGVSDETIQKLIDAEKGNTARNTATAVFTKVEFKTEVDSHVIYQGWGRVYRKWDEDFCRIDGLSFPREYPGKFVSAHGQYHDKKEEKRNRYGSRDTVGYDYIVDLDIHIFELEPGRHTFLFPNEQGSYESQHVVTGIGADSEEQIVLRAPHSYSFQLAPGEIRFYRYEPQQKPTPVKEEESLEAILRDSENFLMLKRRLTQIFGVDIISGITQDHNAGKRGYDILPTLKEKAKSHVRTEYSDYAKMYLTKLDYFIYEENGLVGYIVSWSSAPPVMLSREVGKGTIEFEEPRDWRLDEGDYTMRFYLSAPRQYKQFIESLHDHQLPFSVYPDKTTILRFEKDRVTVGYD